MQCQDTDIMISKEKLVSNLNSKSARRNWNSTPNDCSDMHLHSLYKMLMSGSLSLFKISSYTPYKVFQEFTECSETIFFFIISHWNMCFYCIKIFDLVFVYIGLP